MPLHKIGCHQPFTARRGNQESNRSFEADDALGLLVLHSDLVDLLIMEPDRHHMLAPHSDALVLLQLTDHPHTLRHLLRSAPSLMLIHRL